MNADSIHNTQLRAGAAAFDLSLASAQVEALHSYLSELITWNQRLNLTSIREPELMVRHHLIDCMSVVPLIQPDGHLIDVGSGAGLPGIPINILCPGKTVTLLEPRRKRANFLRHVIRTLHLTNVQVLEKRIQSLSPNDVPLVDETITRAFIDNEGFVRASGLLLRPDGTCILMHGPKGITFLEQTTEFLPAVGLMALPPSTFRLPFGAEERTVLFFKRIDRASSSSAQ